jgi:hypothetical protein
MFQTKVVEKMKTHFMFNNFFPENRAVCEIMWKQYGVAGEATPNNIIQRMRFACWIIKVTNTHSEYVILIACPRLPWLHEHSLLLHYTNIVCLGIVLFVPVCRAAKMAVI